MNPTNDIFLGQALREQIERSSDSFPAVGPILARARELALATQPQQAADRSALLALAESWEERARPEPGPDSGEWDSSFLSAAKELKAFIATQPQQAAHTAKEAGIEAMQKHTLLPCDCGCGRSCCAYCGNDLGFIVEAALSAAPASVPPAADAILFPTAQEGTMKDQHDGNIPSADESAVEKEIQDKGLTAPRITPEHLDSVIADEAYYVFPGSQLTVCCLTLRNGFTVTGESACASPENFDAEIGRKIARCNARDKIWALEGYLLKQSLYQDHCASAANEVQVAKRD